MELRGLFQYLINQLKKGSGTELVLLEVCFALKFVVIVAFLITCFLFVSFLIVSFLVIHIICFCFFLLLFGHHIFPYLQSHNSELAGINRANGECALHREHHRGATRCFGWE
jgi:hypothetical protein